MKLSFTVETLKAPSSLEVSISDLIVAGWAGRDIHAIEHHIEELAAIGVPRPSTVPLYYRCSDNSLVQADTIQVVGEETSGEVETFVFRAGDELFVSIASDHTDRKLESHSVALSKQICAKPVASRAWPFAEVAPHWDQLIIRSFIEENGAEVLYQEGTLASLRSPQDLIAGYSGGNDMLETGTGMVCGTVGAIGGIRPSKTFRMELHDPVLNRTIAHSYSIETLPEIA
ncbi:Protein of uncharacterised function (DUF2848) [Pannonibacter phragmitetus]|uniref:Protein of uncharacterized function (DUF2848) n=1 Tax=Pannonibacter phragmitetus TaxID=121719 RepID=A0A378ZW75_9HYPH|nr:DUF2848 domain-containing protein [Pannonibacter phragmitetus]SUB00791.1 Protein of uncharacterised function (DUF2848) [Pannonibacter phragmitetus]